MERAEKDGEEHRRIIPEDEPVLSQSALEPCSEPGFIRILIIGPLGP